MSKILYIILILLFSLFIYYCSTKEKYVILKEQQKVAFLFLIYDEINNQDLWIQFFKGIDRSKYSIYIHYKHDQDLKEFNDYKLKNCIPTNWGDLSLIKAQNVLLKEAIKDPLNKHFIFLSNSCVPLKPFNVIYDKLCNYNNKSFIHKANDNQVFPRYEHILNFTQKDNIKKQSQWCILCRKHVDILLRDENIYMNWYSGVPIPDESVYITYLTSQKCNDELIITENNEKHTTFINWYEDYKFSYNHNGLPKVYNSISIDEINFLLSSPCFFARKFTKDFENKHVIYKFLVNSNKHLSNNDIPKKLFCFWTGNSPMSDKRKQCFDTMINSQLEVVLITPENLNSYILPCAPLHNSYKYLSETHKADYLRTYFMNFYGGGYSDIKKINDSWIPAYNDLNKNTNMWINGVREFNKSGIPPIPDNNLYKVLVKDYTKLLSNGSYICRPHTNLTETWYKTMIRKMDMVSEKLEKYPARYPQEEYSDSYPYPLRWAELLGEIFHPLCHLYSDHALYTLPPLEYSNYR